MRVLAIIPARGGSKGVLRKNIQQVHGKPLLAYSIELGKQCKQIMDTVVSTDDDEIEAVALSLGAFVIKRPKELASDVSDVADTVSHAILELKEKQNKIYDIIVLLQPTSPLRTCTDISNVIGMFNDDSPLEGVVSVVKVVDNHPARMYKLLDTKKIDPYIKKEETIRRQDLEPLYIRNGCIYAVKTNVFMEKNTLMPTNKKAYVMDYRWAVNVDTEIDLELLEIVLPKWKAIYEDIDN